MLSHSFRVPVVRLPAASASLLAAAARPHIIPSSLVCRTALTRSTTPAASFSSSSPLSNDPPPMQLPSFLSSFMSGLRSRFAASPDSRALSLYHLALRHPLSRPPAPDAPAAAKSAASSATARPSPHSDSLTYLTQLGLPDDELTRYRLIGLHLWMVQKAVLISLGNERTKAEFLSPTVLPFDPTVEPLPAPSKEQQKVLYYLFEHFWSDLIPLLKEARGEIKLTSTLKSVQEYFYGAFVSLDLAWMEAKNRDVAPKGSHLFGPEQIAAVLWRNYYLSDPAANKKEVVKLMYYMHVQMEHLLSLPKDTFWNGGIGAIDWLPNQIVFDKKSGANNDRALAERLGINPAVWRDSSSLDSWKEKLLSGQTFDTRPKKQ